MKHYCLVLTLLTAAVAPAFAQTSDSVAENDAAYTLVINQRAEKIVATLQLADPAKSSRVRDVIAGQYRALASIQGERDTRIKTAKDQAKAAKEAVDTAVKTATAEADAKIDQLHRDYLAKLSAELTPAQVDQVKDGMTYGVLPLTYRVYLEMLPKLTDTQKAQIHGWLVEAREHAMDGGSSKEKHAWFGKYKGRINNYLAAAGIDMKQAEKELANRTKADAENNPK